MGALACTYIPNRSSVLMLGVGNGVWYLIEAFEPEWSILALALEMVFRN